MIHLILLKTYANQLCPPSTLLIEEMVQTNPKYEDCFIKDQMLLTWNIASFSLSIRSYVVGDSTAHSAWTVLHQAFVQFLTLEPPTSYSTAKFQET